MLGRSSSLVSNWISGSYFKIISDNCFLLNRVHPEHNLITQAAELSFCVRDVCSESSWWFELPQEVQLCSFLSDCCVRGETDTASLWLFNSVFSVCGEHVCPFSFGLNVFMWCVTVEHFLLSVFGYWRTSQQRCGLPAGGFLPPCFLYCAALSVKLKCFVFLLSYCSIQPLYFLWFNADLWPTGAAVFLYAVFVLLHCISFK